MEDVYSPLVLAQNKHSRGLKMGSALALQAAFADINIHKNWSVYYWLGPSTIPGERYDVQKHHLGF